MQLKNRSWVITSIIRGYCSSSKMSANHYHALGLTPKATQNDIKTAYYKLSMLHHPDKSDEESSTKKFRAITEAYEVLGNVKLKKIYDKGLLQGVHSPNVYQPDSEPQDPTLKFYKSRSKRQVMPTMDGKTPIYDFDAWSKFHYSETFKKKYAVTEKTKKRHRAHYDRIDHNAKEAYLYIMGLIVAVLVLATYMDEDYDDISKPERKTNSNQR